jgi:hypothetical protein
MFVETPNNHHTGHKVANPKLLSWFMAVAFAFAIYPSTAHAQIVDNIEVNVPFPFHAGNTKLPAGEYLIHPLDDSDLTVMEVSSVDGSVSALFEVQETKADSTPAKNELVFNKYGNRYFLAKLFQEGSSSGSQVLESKYEKRISGQQTMEAQEHVPARPTVARAN